MDRMWQRRKGKEAEDSMELPPCEISRLPEELLSAVLSLSLTTPLEALRAATLSRDFCTSAYSDDVWARFIPHVLPPLADELRPSPSSMMALFMRLSAGPVLVADSLTSMWLDRETGAQCYMLSARKLFIIWGGTPQYWRWIPLTDSRFNEAAELLNVCWLEIHGQMHGQMLSQNTKYAAYIVFKIKDRNKGLDSPLQEAVVSIRENRSTRKACLKGRREPPPEAHVQLPQRRADGWMELEMGEFFNEGADDGEVSISLKETRGGNWKKGLIVYGIEIRAKK